MEGGVDFPIKKSSKKQKLQLNQLRKMKKNMNFLGGSKKKRYLEEKSVGNRKVRGKSITFQRSKLLWETIDGMGKGQLEKFLRNAVKYYENKYDEKFEEDEHNKTVVIKNKEIEKLSFMQNEMVEMKKEILKLKIQGSKN